MTGILERQEEPERQELFPCANLLVHGPDVHATISDTDQFFSSSAPLIYYLVYFSD
jgi:hypothetical protein